MVDLVGKIIAALLNSFCPISASIPNFIKMSEKQLKIFRCWSVGWVDKKMPLYVVFSPFQISSDKNAGLKFSLLVGFDWSGWYVEKMVYRSKHYNYPIVNVRDNDTHPA